MTRFYTKYIPNPETIVDEIIDSIEHFNQDIYKYALHNSHYGNEGKVQILALEVNSKRINIEKEYLRLYDYSLNFNKEFVFEDNKIFATSLRLFRKLRTSISSTKDLFLQFCPYKHDKLRRYQLYRIERPNIFNTSLIASKAEISKDLFDLDSYKPVVKQLLEEMTSFFDIIIKSMRLCKNIIDEEAKIKADSKQCLAIYNRFKEKVLLETKLIRDMLTDEQAKSLKENNPMVKLRDKYGNDEGYAQAGFHNGSIADTRNDVILDAYYVKKHLGLTKYEQAIWGKDVELVKKLRFAIDHFDELIPDYSTRQHIDGKYIALLAKWCGESDLDAFSEYFNEIYNRRSRNCRSVEAKALKKAWNIMIKQGTLDDAYNDFVTLLNDLIAKMDKPAKKVIAS